jgi:hypothetical protein
LTYSAYNNQGAGSEERNTSIRLAFIVGRSLVPLPESTVGLPYGPYSTFVCMGLVTIPTVVFQTAVEGTVVFSGATPVLTRTPLTLALSAKHRVSQSPQPSPSLTLALSTRR